MRRERRAGDLGAHGRVVEVAGAVVQGPEPRGLARARVLVRGEGRALGRPVLLDVVLLGDLGSASRCSKRSKHLREALSLE